MSDFPSTRFERGKVFARTGLKMGTNYAKHYVLKSLNPKDEESSRNKLHTENANELFKEFSRLKGTALKVAQTMSMDQGYLPDEYVDVLAQSQYKVPPINKALVRQIIQKELGAAPEKLFTSFEDEAIAAASIGQVHKAISKEGKELAVKIQYPNVRDTIDSDLSMGRAVLKRLVKGNIEEYFEEIRDKLLEETDYINEGNQINFFAKNYNTDRFATPEWIEELSTNKVLTMTFLKGKHMKEFLAMNPTQDERNNFGQLMWDFFHEQIQRGNMIHADTHPGNFLFLDDGRLGIIDFGCVKNFPPDFFELYLRLLPTHLHGDRVEMRQLYIDMEILKDKPDDTVHEEALTEFCYGFGDCFALPYRKGTFDFGNIEFENTIREFIKSAPRQAEVRGSRHFIFSSRVQIGLYRLLTELRAVIKTDEHIPIVEKKLIELRKENLAVSV